MAMPNIPPELAQALMSNPELMSLLMKPGLMQKLQSNPESARNDPDMLRVMQIMQDSGLANQFQQYAGNMGGMGGMMGGGGAGSGASSSSGGTGELIEVKSEVHFEEIMKTTPADKLVVVDYYATWCGPCKRIAPTYKDLAKTYRNSVVCLKVNVDTTQPLSTNKGIRSMPTFQFFRGGRLLQEMKGANNRQLENLVAQLSEGPKKREKPNPYRHFPARDNELMSFTKVKYDPIVKNIKKFSAEEKACSLSSAELSSLDSIVSTLQDTGNYHNSKFSEEEFKLVAKLLSWPAARLPPVLNLVRVLIWHPDASKHYATEDLLSSVSVFVAAHEENANNALAALRTVLNMFSRHALSTVLLANHEQVVSGISTAMSSTNKNIRLTCASILLNMSIKFRKDAEQYSEGKILVASSLVEALSNEQDVAVAYRLLVAFGTLCFRDEATITVASSLDDNLIQSLLDRFPEGSEPVGTVQNLRACCEELTKALADPSA